MLKLVSLATFIVGADRCWKSRADQSYGQCYS